NARKKLVGLLCLLFFLAGCAARSQQQGQISVRWTTDKAEPGNAAVEVYGLSTATLGQLKPSWDLPQWQRLLSVFAESGNAAVNQNLPPMLGSYRVQSTVLRFEPQFPLEPGITYRAVFHPDHLPGANSATT